MARLLEVPPEFVFDLTEGEYHAAIQHLVDKNEMRRKEAAKPKHKGVMTTEFNRYDTDRVRIVGTRKV